MKLLDREVTTHADGDRMNTIEVLKFSEKSVFTLMFGSSCNYHIMGGGLNVWFRFFSSDELLSVEFKAGERSLYLGLFTSNVIGVTYGNPYDYTELP